MSFLWSSWASGNKKTDAGDGHQAQPPTPTTPKQSFKAMSTVFKRGVNYNMKIVIRGDVMTGKTTLFNRLHGSEFDTSYAATPQIQVANIPWQYKDSADMIKIEIWDVVDKAHNHPKKSEAGIKLEHHKPGTLSKHEQEQQPQQQVQQLQVQQPSDATGNSSTFALDASTINVYRNTHAALFLFDVTKPWTFDYVVEHLSNVPPHVAVLVLGNCCDKSEERVVSTETIHDALYEHNQHRMSEGVIKPNLIRYADISLKNGQGLRYIYDFFGVPFLQLMMEMLQKQLELKATEVVDLLADLDDDENVPEKMRRQKGQDNFDRPAVTAPAAFKKSPSLTFEEKLEDDWFGDDDPIQLGDVRKQVNDEEEEQGSLFVAADEDVESIEYFHDSKQPISLPSQVQSDDSEEQKEEPPEEPTHYKSHLEDAWRSSTAAVIPSDSDDEDNLMTRPAQPLYSIYEEIGDSGSNPWSLDKVDQTHHHSDEEDGLGGNEDGDKQETQSHKQKEETDRHHKKPAKKSSKKKKKKKQT